MNTIFRDRAREDTGASLLDSGGAYGRHHEGPPVQDGPIATMDPWRNEVLGRIETARWMEASFEPREDLQAEWNKWEEEHGKRGYSYFESAEDFMESRGYVQRVRGNVYNGENEFSQVFVFEVWTPTEGEDWLWADDAVVVLYIHTGCDVRGGYSRPIFAESMDFDYSMPMDFVAGFTATEGRDRNGEPLSEDRLREIDREWQCGYSSLPSYHMEDDLERVFTFTLSEDKTSVVAKLTTGEIVKIHVYSEADWR